MDGAAIFTADQRAGAMHGKQFLLDSVYAGIDGTFVYGRLDFAGPVPEMAFDLVVNLESWASGEARSQADSAARCHRAGPPVNGVES